MNDDMLDKILYDVYSEPLIPSEDLIKRTKKSLTSPGLLYYAIALSVTLNLASAVLFTCITLWDVQSTVEKVIVFSTAAVIQNIMILIICLFKEKLQEIFNHIEADIL